MLTQLESSMRALLGGEGPNPGTDPTTVGTEENPLSRLVRAFQNATEGRSATDFHPPDALSRVSTRLPIRGSRASEIYAEWTYEGRRTVDECVRLSRWRDAKLKIQAQHVARAVDALKDSGLDPATEPAGEVLLRQLVALFFQDRGGDPGVADMLRAHSETRWGLPDALLREAATHSKILGYLTSPGGKAPPGNPAALPGTADPKPKAKGKSKGKPKAKATPPPDGG